MKFINDNSLLNDSKKLLSFIENIKEDTVIVIDEESAGIFLPKEKIVIIESQSTFTEPSWEKYNWDDYVKEVKENG